MSLFERVEDVAATLTGRIFEKVYRGEINGNDAIILEGLNTKFAIYHAQDCCESVEINDICGDLEDLQGSAITRADIRSSENEGEHVYSEWHYSDSYTWTFVELASNKGSVTIRWFGSSNGYYSETADLYMEVHP